MSDVPIMQLFDEFWQPIDCVLAVMSHEELEERVLSGLTQAEQMKLKSVSNEKVVERKTL